MERYWDRRQWDLEVEALMNPFGGGEAEDEGADEDPMKQIFKQPAIDATDAGGLSYLQSELNIPVKIRHRKKE